MSVHLGRHDHTRNSEEKLSSALKAVLGEELPADFRASVTPSADLRFGDYQSNAAMVLAKRCRTNPRALAQQVADRIGQDAVCSLEIAGPGFINFRIRPDCMGKGASWPCWRMTGWGWKKQAPKPLSLTFLP